MFSAGYYKSIYCYIDLTFDNIIFQDIIHNVIQGSSSFKDKTSYSQEKYIRKKEKKLDFYQSGISKFRTSGW